MLTGMSDTENVLSTFRPYALYNISNRIFLNQVLHWSTFPSSFGYVDEILPESTTEWLIHLLDLFTNLVNHNQDLNQVKVTETDYNQLSEILDDLIHSVGEDENHPLAETMTLVGVLIKTYEDRHFPKLTEDVLVDTSSNNSDATTNQSGQIYTDFVNVLYSIGCLFWNGGNAEKAISAYDLALSISPDNPILYTSRGEAKSGQNDLKAAKADLQYALKLAEKQREDHFSISINNRLNEFDIVEAATGYLADTKFSKLSVIRECRIQLGTFHSRADIVLRDAEGNFITIVECKRISDTDKGESSHEPLKSYICATDALYGIFASSINPDSWVYYENLRHNRFQQITRADFEEQVLANS